jgi:cell division septation protein DedD
MKFSADDFKRLYAAMPDEELRSLVREELSEVARPCYDAELARRGLHAKPPRRAVQPIVTPDPHAEIAPESEDPADEASAEEVEREEEEDLAPAAVFASREEAKTARALLQSAAIPAFLENDTTAGGGFRLLVATPDVEKASEVLAEAQ